MERGGRQEKAQLRWMGILHDDDDDDGKKLKSQKGVAHHSHPMSL
jgi:hypothetical protein